MKFLERVRAPRSEVASGAVGEQRGERGSVQLGDGCMGERAGEVEEGHHQIGVLRRVRESPPCRHSWTEHVHR